jgi:hypothetical protein
MLPLRSSLGITTLCLGITDFVRLLVNQIVEVVGSLQMATQQTLQNAMHDEQIDRLRNDLARACAGQLHHQHRARIVTASRCL